MGGVTIPEDVKRAAYALVDKMKADDPGFDYSPYEFAIAAMWAERQRCAKIALNGAGFGTCIVDHTPQALRDAIMSGEK